MICFLGLAVYTNLPMIRRESVSTRGRQYGTLDKEYKQISEFMDKPTIRRSFYDNIFKLTAFCTEPVKIGHPYDGLDGAWWMCEADDYKPPQNSCLVYSVGISKDWTFDDTISQRYGCEVHSFDPSINLTDHMRSPLIHFHNIGLGGKNEINGRNWSMLTLCSIVKQLNHTGRTIDMLKVHSLVNPKSVSIN